MARLDPQIAAHLEWIGFVRPTGLVVSAPALVKAGAHLNRRDSEGQQLLRGCVEERGRGGDAAGAATEPEPRLPDFRAFASSVLGWNFSPAGYAGTEEAPIPAELEAVLSEGGEVLRPDFAVRAEPVRGASAARLESAVRESAAGYSPATSHETAPGGGAERERTVANGASPWQLLVSICEPHEDFDHVTRGRSRANGGLEASPHGRMERLLRHTGVPAGLLTVVLRLVFLLYAEERDMLPQDETFLGAYSLAGLYERLREDAALNPDTMDQRFGGYAQLLALFRMVHDGARAGAMRLPPRHGALFDPDRYRFLEGRGEGGARQIDERIDPPLVPDGTIYRVLEKLIVLDGERISYRALDVEHVGSVYETMMGFRLETAEGLTVAIRAAKKQGAPAAVNLNALLDQPPAGRAKWLQDRTDRKLTDKLRRATRDAGTMEALHAALDPVIDRNATPDLVPEGAIVLQPSEERRRSGSHYTPRELTEPIVRTALAPIFDRLRTEAGGPLRPEQILDLKVCDPAMGSGAFLVEACRQLGDALVEAWQAHDTVPEIPPDESEIIFARRQVAQRCLYGVDRNPKAVDLAKLSLWLVTLAKDHPLTFLDHALRPGDALVGLSRRQLETFHWKDDAKPFQAGFESMRAREQLARASGLRRRIREADDSVSELELRQLCDDARRETDNVRLLGDLALAAFFEGAKPKQREDVRRQFADAVQRGEMHGYVGWLEELRRKEPPLAPFHWEIEFPEVFDRGNPGFDAVVGNPPFLGGKRISTTLGDGYRDWLTTAHVESNSNTDIVAHFFRRAFDVVRTGGTCGLIATNTIAQGDTRSTGLRWICNNGGQIYDARRRVKWPGLAAVVVSVLHVHKGRFPGVKRLDGEAVKTITAFLFHRGGHDDPARLDANAGRSFVGSYVLGKGFTFDDTDTKGVATPLAEMHRLIEEEPRNREAIFAYIGGEEVTTNPSHTHHRYVINFRDYPLRREDLGNWWANADEERRHEWVQKGIVPLDYPQSVAADWPRLLEIVEAKAKPERDVQKRKALRERWWHYADKRPGLYAAVENLHRVLVVSQVTQYLAFAFLESGTVYSHRLYVFANETDSFFAILQSSTHDVWARFFGSSLEDRFMYASSACFETYPFPDEWNTHPDLELAGMNYYRFRAELMIRHSEGLTKTYNRFHEPDETDPEIATLRDLHAAMDRAVLNAYGWTDIPTDCEFLLDYEIDEEEWSTRKKPYRYRWPDEVRDEVLARLLELNAERSEAEQRSGGATRTTRPGTDGRRPRGRVAGNTPLTTPVPGTLWSDNPLDNTYSGGNPDGTET